MVIVVGAGPAGATAARTLARAGIAVRLLDRAAFPRNKPCGGAISMRVLRRFPWLERELARISTHIVRRLHLESPSGASTLVESDGAAALMIRRFEFDDLLVRLAVEAGAELITGVDVVRAAVADGGATLSARDGRSFHAPVVIAADGVHSPVARSLGIRGAWPRRAVALDMMEETPRAALRDRDPDALWVVYGYDHRHQPDHDPMRRWREGYAYVFPKRDHVNVGVGYLLADYDPQADGAPYDVQRGFVEHLRRRGVLSGASVRQNFTPFLIPVDGPLATPGRGPVLLAGDAGGFVNGITAEGIYYAMVSGELAAKTVIAAGAGATAPADLVSRYSTACNREVGLELGDAVVIRRYLFARFGRLEQVVGSASHRPALVGQLLDYVMGKIEYRTLRRTLVRAAPGLAFSLLWNRARMRTRQRAADASGM